MATFKSMVKEHIRFLLNMQARGFQMRWQTIPEKRRRAFKEAMESDGETEIGGIPVKVSSHRVMDQYVPFDSALELNALTCLSTLIC